MRLHEKIKAHLDRNQTVVMDIKMSLNEFRQILDDPDAREFYSDGAIYGVTIVFTDHDAWGN